MTDAPDIEQLARRYLDLWQDQAAAMVNDPALAETIGQTYALMSKGAAAFFAAGSPEKSNREEGADSKDVRSAENTKVSSPGAASSATLSGGSSLDSADLATRVADLEERVLRLEASFAAGGGRSKTKSRKGRA
jgi:hypothetical protein